MSTRRRIFGMARGGACVGLGVVLTLAVVNVQHRPSLAGGSLPLQGDEFVAGDGAPVDRTAFGSGSHWNVFNWAPGELGAVPSSFSYNTVDDSGETVKKMYIGTGSQPDAPTADSTGNMSTSLDSGKTFLTDRTPDFNQVLSAVRLLDGTFVSPEFTPEWTDATQTAVNLQTWKSKDGVKWKEYRAPVTMPQEYQLGPMSFGLRIHRRALQLADGTLIVPFYTIFKGTNKQRSGVLQSTDSGRSWSLRSVIPATTQPGTNEVGWSRTSDGRLIAVMRTVHSPETHLVQSFSDDAGKTWSEAVDVIGPDGVPVRGIFPDLVLQPNGTLLMTVGRPDVRVLVSNDGTGRSWQVNSTVFANHPSTGNNGRYDGSSGNNTMENVSANRSILFYDQCHVWGCGAYDQQFGVSAEYVASVTPGVGKIDVATKLRSGTASVTGLFTKRDKVFPEMRPEGAFDGSSATGAEARLVGRRGTAGELVLKLDKPYRVNRIGLMLGHGEPQSATVLTSPDGINWSKPVVQADNRSDWAMRYTDFEAINARYLKLIGAVDATTTVSELEIYSADVDGFENELPFAVPRGWTEATHAWVTDVPNNPAYSDIGGHDSDTVLRLWDKWTDDNARISKPFAATQRVHASMQWGSADTRARFNFGVRGTAADGSSVAAWQFRLAPGSPASLQVFDGAEWATVGQLSGPLPLRTYVPLSVHATTTSATVSLGSDSFTTTTRAADVSEVTALTFTTGDPAEYGGIYYLDDVSVAVDPGALPTLDLLSVNPPQVVPGRAATVSSEITNTEDRPATEVTAELAVPDGWTAEPIQAPADIPAGGTVPVSWALTAPAAAAIGTYRVQASTSYRSGDATMTTIGAEHPVYLGVVPQHLFTATATTSQPTFDSQNAVDGDLATFWHSKYTPTKDVPPQSITLDLGGTYTVSGLVYEPRTNSDNGIITAYNVYTSSDGASFSNVGAGSWAADHTRKTADFPAGAARFVRLEATAAVGDYITAAEINVINASG